MIIVTATRFLTQRFLSEIIIQEINILVIIYINVSIYINILVIILY